MSVTYGGTIPEQPRYFDWSDGLRFVNLKPAAEWLKADYQALRYAAVQLCAGVPIRTPAAELIRAHFPELASPRRLVEPGTVAI